MTNQQANSINHLLTVNANARRGEGSKLWHRAQRIIKDQNVRVHTFSDGNKVAYVKGSNGETYRAVIQANGERKCNCACDHDCKHLIALALTIQAA